MSARCRKCLNLFVRPPGRRIAFTALATLEAQKIGAVAPNYCGDCLADLFANLVMPSGPREGRESETGGGAWVNPKRGDTR